MSGEEPADGLTRRSVLRGAAAAGAASFVRPSAAVAALVGPRGTAVGLASGGAGVFSRWIGALAGESGPIAAPRRFALVGLEWSAPARASVELRTRPRAGSWGRWALASVLGHGPDRAPDRGAHFAEPIWSGPADYVQLRSSGAVRGVRLHFIAARPTPPGAHASQALPLAQPVLDAGPGQPPIIARSAWAGGQATPGHIPVYGALDLAIVHHSVSPNGYGPGDVPSLLLGIFDYHRYVRDYWDIAYNFAVDAFGRIWEARAGGIDLPVVGAHAGGYNAESTGVVVLGTFADVAPPGAAIAALEQLLAWKLSLHGVPALGRATVEVAPSDAFFTPFAPGALVSLPRVAGHRDGDVTDCPGNALYGELPSIRPRAAALAGAPARLAITAPSTPVHSGAAVAVSGRLTDLSSGSPLAGAPIELQQITPGAEQTIAALTTAADGSWSARLTPAGNTLVRALHRPAPAAVSEVMLISVAPALTLGIASQAPTARVPLAVSGTVSPARRRVTVDLYRAAHGRRRLIASKRVTVGAAGGFQATFKPPRAGRYALIARTPAGARYAAGASASVEVTVS
jgi:hypothetical protein